MEYVSNSPEETEELGAALAGRLNAFVRSELKRISGAPMLEELP